MTDLHGELSSVAYDGFGRVTSITKPDPTTPGGLSLYPSVMVTYILPTDASATPYTRVFTQTQNGANPSVWSYQESWTYVDGFGRTVASLAEADPSAGDGAPWIASAVDRDAKGATSKSFLPFFYSGDASAYPLASAPASSYGRQTYDAFGRASSTYGARPARSRSSTRTTPFPSTNGTPPTWTQHPHDGTFASSAERRPRQGDLHDGARNHLNGVIESYLRQTTYLPTGEPTDDYPDEPSSGEAAGHPVDAVRLARANDLRTSSPTRRAASAPVRRTSPSAMHAGVCVQRRRRPRGYVRRARVRRRTTPTTWVAASSARITSPCTIGPAPYYARIITERRRVRGLVPSTTSPSRATRTHQRSRARGNPRSGSRGGWSSVSEPRGPDR